MDNLTHSLAGFCATEIYFQNKSISTSRRRFFHGLSLVANNFPDIDITLSKLIQPPLGYLLHHRGHTHTLLGAFFLSLGVSFIFGIWGRRKFSDWQKKDLRNVFTISFLGFAIHIALDSLNSYGIHPFWPWNNRWFYGDALFIIEPILWALLLPLILRADLSRLWKALTVGLIAVSIVWFCLDPRLAMQSRSILMIIFTIHLIVRKTSSELVFRTALGGTLIFIAIHLFISRYLKSELTQQIPADEQLEEVVISPFPANPFCWRAILISHNSNELIHRKGTVKLGGFPCPEAAFTSTATFLPSQIPSTSAVTWQGENKQLKSTFKDFYQRQCEFRAFLRFSRSPFIEPNENKWILGDHRFDRDNDLGFTEWETTVTRTNCQGWIPPWTPPRQHWLE